MFPRASSLTKQVNLVAWLQLSLCQLFLWQHTKYPVNNLHFNFFSMARSRFHVGAVTCRMGIT